MNRTLFYFIIFGCFLKFGYTSYLFIPMDEEQNNHLKAYGLTYFALKNEGTCKWILNYRGGSFLLPYSDSLYELALQKGVLVQKLSQSQYTSIKLDVKERNMSELKLEKAPNIAVYTPPNTNPWADAVTLVMEYSEIPYDKIYDQEVLNNSIEKYDWLHLHHEDFTGQYSKFWFHYRTKDWFKEKVSTAERSAKRAGYKSVREHKLSVAKAIQVAVSKGLFLFAMCTATETLDLALSSQYTDVVSHYMDHTPIDSDWKEKVNYNYCFAFENFNINTSPYVNSFSDIDYNQINTINKKETKDFVLFDFSAKLDPIPSLLTQSHKNRILGFYGQTTSFRNEVLKDGIIVLAESLNKTAKYIHGNYGKGSFTFYAGHAPEDKNHYIGDEAPNMELHKNSPGFRLILNNILFPSAKPAKKKT